MTGEHPKRTVLVVNDNVEICNAIEIVLEDQKSMDLYVVKDAQQALDLVQGGFKVNIAYVDHHLGHYSIDGDQIIRELRKNNYDASIYSMSAIPHVPQGANGWKSLISILKENQD